MTCHAMVFRVPINATFRRANGCVQAARLERIV